MLLCTLGFLVIEINLFWLVFSCSSYLLLTFWVSYYRGCSTVIGISGIWSSEYIFNKVKKSTQPCRSLILMLILDIFTTAVIFQFGIILTFLSSAPVFFWTWYISSCCTLTEALEAYAHCNIRIFSGYLGTPISKVSPRSLRSCYIFFYV